MKIKYLAILLCLAGCILTSKEDNSKGDESTIISKIRYKSNTNEIDTLWVSQNDTTKFKKEEILITRPCSNPELSIQYILTDPVNDAYYFIYNDKQQLIMEGKYTREYTYAEATIKEGNFYNSKDYSYRKNGSLDLIHYMKDGRNYKTEYFDRKKRLTKIRYFDKRSGNLEKIELYKNDQLKETRVYTSFSNYYTIKESS